MTKILLADHQCLFRAGVVKLIDSIGGFAVAGEVDTAEAAVEFAAKHTPDMLLLEMAMPGISGFETLRRIQRLQVGTRVVALTQWTNQPLPLHAMRAGIAGYLGKDISPAEFKTALHKIRFGRRYISENIVRDLARVAYGDLSDNPFQQLSVREMQIMLMVLGCKSPSAIAQVLHLSAKTVNSYRYRLFEKLGVNSDVELVIMAIQHEVVDLGAQTGDRPRSTVTSSDRKEPLATGTAIDLNGCDNRRSSAGHALDKRTL